MTFRIFAPHIENAIESAGFDPLQVLATKHGLERLRPRPVRALDALAVLSLAEESRVTVEEAAELL